MDREGLPRRRSIRLQGFEYTENRAYFVTICATKRLCLFGDVLDGVLQLSAIGRVVAAAWLALPDHTSGLTLDAWAVMPNHLHGIVVLPGAESVRLVENEVTRGLRPGSLGAVIGGFKSAVSRDAGARNLTLVRPIWQRNYHERIIRDDRELDAIRRYIVENPGRWDEDPDHPRHHGAPRAPRPM